MTGVDMTYARELISRGKTFAAVKDGRVISDTRRGIAPLISIYDGGDTLSGFSAADKVVGAAAAFMYVLLDVGELYAEVISKNALAVLNKYGIKVDYGTLSDAIINRQGTGRCPMESAVDGINEPEAALAAIKAKIKELALNS